MIITAAAAGDDDVDDDDEEEDDDDCNGYQQLRSPTLAPAGLIICDMIITTINIEISLSLVIG